MSYTLVAHIFFNLCVNTTNCVYVCVCVCVCVYDVRGGKM